MRKLLKRLTGNQGSVLVMVLSVMTMLVVLVSSAYFIVSNQQSSVTERYSNEQSYQSAMSICAAVSDYIDDYVGAMANSGKELKEFGDSVVMKALSGKTVTSKDMDLKKMGLDDEGVANAEIKIGPSAKSDDSYIDDDGSEVTVQYIEITVKTNYNGESNSITLVKGIKSGPTEYFTRFLTSTGENPDDVAFSAMSVLSDAYFENDFTQMNNPSYMNDSFYSSGCVYDTGLQFASGSAADDLEMIVAKNYVNSDAAGSSMFVGEFYVGGDFIHGNGGDAKQISADNIYILGDYDCSNSSGARIGDTSKPTNIYIAGDCYTSYCLDSRDAVFYINGDLHIADGNNKGTLYVGGDVYLEADVSLYTPGTIKCAGSIITNGHTYSGDIQEHCSDAVEPFSKELQSKAKQKITEDTSKQKYQEWDAESYFEKLDGASSAVVYPDQASITYDEWGGEASSDVSKITYNNGSGEEITAATVERIGNQWNNSYNTTITSSCVLTPGVNCGNAGVNNIIIDTSLYNEDIYVYLQPEAGTDVFSFGGTGQGNGKNFNVFIKGKNSVIFVLPEGVNFESGSSYIGHIDFAKYMTGVYDEDVLCTMNVRDSFKGTAATGNKITDVITIGENGETIIDNTAIGGDYHNNIFMVSKGTSNIIDMSGNCTFCGYIYAPKAVLKADSNYEGLNMVGGLIMGSYTYLGKKSTLVFSQPYDYYDIDDRAEKADIVKYLMNRSNAGSESNDEIIVQGVTTIGYK